MTQLLFFDALAKKSIVRSMYVYKQQDSHFFVLAV
jgi:hypothetical protein